MGHVQVIVRSEMGPCGREQEKKDQNSNFREQKLEFWSFFFWQF